MNKLFSRHIRKLPKGSHIDDLLKYPCSNEFLFSASPKVIYRQTSSQESDNLAKTALRRRLETGKTIDIIRDELPLFLGPPFQLPKRILSLCSPNVAFYYRRLGGGGNEDGNSVTSSSKPLKLVLAGKNQLALGVKFLSTLQMAVLDDEHSSFRLSHSHFVDIGLKEVSVTTRRIIDPKQTFSCNSDKSSFYLIRFIYEPRIKGFSESTSSSIFNQKREAQLIFEFADWRDRQSSNGQIKRIIYETHSIPLLRLIQLRTVTLLNPLQEKPSACCVKGFYSKK